MLASLATAIFLIAYVFIALEKVNRVAVVSAGAALMVLLGITDAEAAFYSHETGIDWNVIFLLLGMMIIVGIIHKTGLFDFLAITAIKAARGNPRTAFVYILIIVSIASALLDNVTTILLAVPMTFLLAKYLRVSPIPFILSEVFVSNIGGAATLIGDPPNIIIASKADLDFNDFLVHMAPVSALALIIVISLLFLIFRKQLQNSADDRTSVLDLKPADFITDQVLLIKSLCVLGLVIVAFVLHSVLHIEPSMVAMIGAGLLVLLSRLKPSEFAMDVEWGTLAFFAGLFIMVGGLVNVGVLRILAENISNALGGNGVLGATVVVVFSALVSGVVDNIPFVASMIPVIQGIQSSLQGVQGDGIWWALALGADFGGNLTIIGASANVVAIGLARANGLKISFWQFAKIGIPVTAVSVLVALPYVLIRYF